MIRSKIKGVGHAVPERVVTNADLEKLMDTTDEWITERSGIKKRHHVDGDISASDLGVEAARSALEMAQVKPEDVE
ncbi:MAG TPA: 3-oxoacyl-ACP synthase, partial [Candidatus Marinimicrobia bacterium]|nr:3-oxoacyl-ACP synthase [Candidatus Neomarinimicrobiota bacterium]